MTLNDPEWLFHVEIRFRPTLLHPERLTFKNRAKSLLSSVTLKS